MNSLIQVLDIVSAILLVLCLNLVIKDVRIGRIVISSSYKYWLLYSLVSVIFVIVCAYKGLPGYTIMGIILIFTGLRNYRAGKRKRNESSRESEFKRRLENINAVAEYWWNGDYGDEGGMMAHFFILCESDINLLGDKRLDEQDLDKSQQLSKKEERDG